MKHQVERILIIFASIILLFAYGCDFSANSDLSDTDTEQIFSLTDDVFDRVTFYNAESSKANQSESGLLNDSAVNYLSIVARVSPPVVNGEVTRASHLDFDGNNIFTGYKSGNQETITTMEAVLISSVQVMETV
jgi:hypothetical protein